MGKEKDTKTICKVCRGPIVELLELEHDPATGPPVYGPASKRQSREVSKGFHCKECGIKYQFPPK